MANQLYLKFSEVQTGKTCHAKFQTKQSKLKATEKDRERGRAISTSSTNNCALQAVILFTITITSFGICVSLATHLP